ncbi:MAG: DUF4912 domain-containing protein [Proteobacteria bacterium]|nr:DUF4912 domain-containing protein [Pseudomonadota bacterium]
MSAVSSSSGGSSEAGGIPRDPGDATASDSGGRLVLLVRDPTSLYAHWELFPLPVEGAASRWALRLFDLTTRNPAATIEYSCPVGAQAGQVTEVSPERRYRAELGSYDALDRWQLRLESNAVQTPPASPSSWIDDRFVTIDWETTLSGYAPPPLAEVPPPPLAAPLAAGDRRDGTLLRKPLPGMPGAAAARAPSASDAVAEACEAPAARARPPLATAPLATGPGAAARARPAPAPGAAGARSGSRWRLDEGGRQLLPLPPFAPLCEALAGGSTAFVVPAAASDGPGG